MSLIVSDYDGHHGYYDNQGWPWNNFDRRQVSEQRRFPHSSYNNTNVNNPTLDGYSTKQALTQTSLNSIQEYNGCNMDATIP